MLRFLVVSFIFWNTALLTAEDAPEEVTQERFDPLAITLWQRQNLETRKTQELTSLLERLVGPGKAAVHMSMEWPSPQEEATAVVLNPSRFMVTIVLDKSVKAADAKFIQNLCAKVLGLDFDPQGRGDRLEIFQLSGHGFLSELIYSPQSLLELIKFFVLVLLALIVTSSVLRAAREIGFSLERVATEKRTHDIDVTVSPKMPPGVTAPQARARIQATTSGSGATLESTLIPALAQVDSETLARVLEEESSRSIALFIATLEPDLASKALASLTPSKQEEVAITLSQMESEPDPREVAQLQAQIHLKLRKLLLEKH